MTGARPGQPSYVVVILFGSCAQRFLMVLSCETWRGRGFKAGWMWMRTFVAFDITVWGSHFVLRS